MRGRLTMEELFSSNLFAIYIIACIAVISYTNFKENQRMFLLYLFTYATAFFEIFRISASIILLLLITFIFLEYLTEDTKKLTLVTNIVYKIYDYIFMMVFQYHFLWIFFSVCNPSYFSLSFRLPDSDEGDLYHSSLSWGAFSHFSTF